VEVKGEELVGGRVVDTLLHVRLRGRGWQTRVHAPEQLAVHVQLPQLSVVVQACDDAPLHTCQTCVAWRGEGLWRGRSVRRRGGGLVV
jgi:hypothetical protein